MVIAELMDTLFRDLKLETVILRNISTMFLDTSGRTGMRNWGVNSGTLLYDKTSYKYT